ncbi:MAG TPA: TM2 domain-containing protein [Leptospiraceae bacterium]|nr:TM2 domain-containing protein [Leptospiraceae bacterium]HMW06642.1 TM2 domain-containing protein [Leptospiraceae bacterium]HMX35529.1 TM2 domain-containing protein [Leptospiraceae bacterium]HMY33693.1 TM2 domain-containing protein [Leptospiraceae bacterium]HMZ64897.1 TM2 domain-containing protein [Leptospiraceae bacterium]
MAVEQSEISSKSRLITLLLSFLFVHRFYVGRIVSGIFFFFTAGGFGFWWLIDVIQILSGSFKDQFGKFILNWEADKKQLTLSGVALGFVVLLAMLGGKNKNGETSSPTFKDALQSSGSNSTEEKKSFPTVGDKIQTSHFAITLKGYKIQNSVKTGNMFSKLDPEEGNKYLVLDVNYKNTDNESRMIGGEGKVFVEMNGKEFEYDKSEHILLDGWGVLLDQLNPMTQKNTKLVFKIPDELKGKIYWEPVRSSDRFFVGEAK